MAAYDLQALLTGTELGNLGSAVAKAVEKHAEAARERLAEELVAVIDQGDRAVTEQVCHVKTIRNQEKDAVKRLKTLARAVDYLKETGNPLPYFDAIGCRYQGSDFCGTVGVAVPDSEDSLWSVPKDFLAESNEDEG